MRAATTINDALRILETSPDIGRPYFKRVGDRELLIPFGASGYVALYRHDPVIDAVFILAFRHQKEVGY